MRNNVDALFEFGSISFLAWPIVCSYCTSHVLVTVDVDGLKVFFFLQSVLSLILHLVEFSDFHNAVETEGSCERNSFLNCLFFKKSLFKSLQQVFYSSWTDQRAKLSGDVWRVRIVVVSSSAS